MWQDAGLFIHCVILPSTTKDEELRLKCRQEMHHDPVPLVCRQGPEGLWATVSAGLGGRPCGQPGVQGTLGRAAPGVAWPSSILLDFVSEKLAPLSLVG